jgi:trans-aconitate methyltransferase
MSSTAPSPAPSPTPTSAGQTWNAEGYARDAGFVPALGSAVLDLLAPAKDEKILDLGCGDGVLTVRLAEAGATVVGVDASAEMIAAAKERGLDAHVVDGHGLAFNHDFDAVFSNAALHWMSRDPDAVIAGVRRALKPRGRFVGEFGGHGNVAAICTALVAALNKRGIDGAARLPWFFPSADDYRRRLENHGFQVETIALIPRPTPLPTGMEGWLRTFADPFLHGLTDSDRQGVLDDAVALLTATLRDVAGNWTADYVRLRFKATLTD